QQGQDRYGRVPDPRRIDSSHRQSPFKIPAFTLTEWCVMWFASHKSKMPSKEEALTGRAQRMPLAPRHFVSGAKMEPPFAVGAESEILGWGGFGGAERRFGQEKGVLVTAVGYAGGYTPNPTYEEVCSGLTGHAEVVLVVFDPKVTSYEALLKIFWES